ncbi:amidohydrolase [Clostridium ihumii]|uniref:amidohydrolase n=1 Tax=Clostridium ihumii TaxID=1470356 RepID=UPI003D32D38E
MSEKLYFNGDILTMENELYVEALLIKNDKIFKTGSKDELIKVASKEVEFIDLQGKTLMPSFIDSHSHFSGYATSLLQVSVEEATNFNDIIDSIQNFIKKNNIKSGEWISVKGYDHNNLTEKTHPTKEILDKAAPNNPVALQHQSGHNGVFNSKALDILNIKSETPNPSGGIIEKENGEPTGYVEENAYVNNIQKVPMPSMEDLSTALVKAQDKYASYGITTMQEGMIVPMLGDILDLLRVKNLLKLDLIGYIDLRDYEILVKRFNSCIKKYENHLKIGGYKIFLDGSPQSRTAWMLEPYKNGEANYMGYPIYEDNALTEKVTLAIKDDMQLLAHCNGDAACKQYINAYNDAIKNAHTKNDIRPVIIHAQLLRKDQLDDVKRLNMIPSFFVAHVYHWGDIHVENFGFERASSISLANSALKKGIKFTFHQDSPVIEPNMLETVWCSVNRITKKGIVLGQDERIEPLEALKAVTINAAYQYFEEDLKGSLKENKLADLIILNENPLKVDKMDIKSIKVLETIKEGKTIFKL